MAAFKPFHHTGFWSKDTPRAKSRSWLKGRAAARPFFMPKFRLAFLPARLNA
jgi:hypothetical protein